VKWLRLLAITIEKEQYYCKALSNETIKISVTTSESYRKLIKQLQQVKVLHHTYQIREERAHGLVIRNLHHSVIMDEIKHELEKQGYTVHNILNIRHR
jgi:CYTH domain-containing protein